MATDPAVTNRKSSRGDQRLLMTGIPRSTARNGGSRWAGGRVVRGGRVEHSPNLIEPIAWWERIRVAGRFVRADVPVIGCIRFWLHAGTSWRTMDREASTKGTAAPRLAGAETCGGVMIRGPKSGNGTQSSAYFLDSADLVSPRPRPPGPVADPGQRDGSAGRGHAGGRVARGRSGDRRRWRGAGGRWLLWPLRVVLWTALLVIVFRGITAIIFNPAAAPAGGTGTGTRPGAVPGQPWPRPTRPSSAGYIWGSARRTWPSGSRLWRPSCPPSVSAADPNLGWNGIGQLNLQSLQVAGVTVQDPQHAVVTLLALISGQLMELGVPVAATGGGLVVSAEPAWLPAPPRISPPASPQRFGPGGPKPADE